MDIKRFQRGSFSEINRSFLFFQPVSSHRAILDIGLLQIFCVRRKSIICVSQAEQNMPPHFFVY